MLNVKANIVSKMTNHSVGTVQMREELERGIKSEKRCDLRQEEGGSNVQWKTVPQPSGCDRKRSVADNGEMSMSNIQSQ